MSYLNIDNLSTFYKTDIADNPDVKAIFVEAGCAEVFELPEYIYNQDNTDQKMPLADKIKAYMTLNNQEMDYESYVNEQMPER